MFTDLPSVEPATTELFTTPFGDRVGELMARPRRVAWVYRAPDTSTFRYRAANMIAAVNADPEQRYSASWFADPDLDGLVPLVPYLDALVVVRYPVGPGILRLLAAAEHHGVPVVWDCDDLVFDPRLTPMLMDAVAVDLDDPRNWELWYAYSARLQAVMERCGSALTTVGPLRDRLAERFADGRVRIVPNFLGADQQRVSETLLSAKRESGWSRTEEVVVGYFSGTPTHARDFDVVAPALRRLLTEDEGTRLRIVGRVDVPTQLAGLGDRIETVPFTDPLSLQRLIAEVEVNLAPLQHHPFTACKSELKVFEASAVGTWTVASDTPPLRSAIRDGSTGRVVRAHEWDAALREAVALARDADDYAERAEQAAADAYARYGWDTHTDDIVAALDAAASSTGDATGMG